jgi:hypothetical protein
MRFYCKIVFHDIEVVFHEHNAMRSLLTCSAQATSRNIIPGPVQLRDHNSLSTHSTVSSGAWLVEPQGATVVAEVLPALPEPPPLPLPALW